MNRQADRHARRLAERRGRIAEEVAAWSCRLRGFRVLAQRYRTPFGGIDLVLRRRSLVVFVEVKARASREQALYALRPQQQMQLTRAATLYLRDHAVHANCTMRFDLIALCPWRWPLHIENAWQAHH